MQKDVKFSSLPESKSELQIQGLRENNFKNVNFNIPHDQINVVCGPSGSGKTTLAFDTIYAEGGRRYIETFNPYTRQFLDRLKEPDSDGLKNVRPALALEQRNRVTSSRSTVGTLTDINDYLKIFWSQQAELHCPKCKLPVRKYTPDEVVNEVLSKNKDSDNQILITFEIPLKSKASKKSVSEMLQSQGFQRFVVLKKQLEIYRIEALPEVLTKSASTVTIVVDRISLGADGSDIKDLRTRLVSSVGQAYNFSRGTCGVIFTSSDGYTIINYKNNYSCVSCHNEFTAPTPSLFSFNSAIGACKECQGFGKVLKIDPLKCIPDENKSIEEGAVICWEGPAARRERAALYTYCESEEIPVKVAWKALSKVQQQKILNGGIDQAKKVSSKKKAVKFKGVFPWFEMLQGKRHKMHVRVFLARYRSEFLCPLCEGSRLSPEASSYTIKGITLKSFWELPISDALDFMNECPVPKESEVVHQEIISRLGYLVRVGLSYLTLDRQAKTLSGGEFQRVNLTTILGTNLVNTTLVLDEPTIGLHPRDTTSLIGTMRDLQSKGNSLIVVEHDPDVIQSADRVYEIGPASGREGGMLVFEGAPEELYSQETKTGAYFRKVQKNEFSYSEHFKENGSSKKKSYITIQNAHANNLKYIAVKIPKGVFSVLAGVSGSGKSSLVYDCLYEPVSREGISKKVKGQYSSILGLEGFSEVVLIDQQPIGKTSRANPGTYTKAWDIFREYLAETESAKQLGLSKSSFSFNVDGGRCPVCKGNGSVKIEMQFLTDVYVECEVCQGRRFLDQVLTVQLGNKNVYQWLQTSISDVYEELESLPDMHKNKKIADALKPLCALGLGYLPLGHPLSALSGGEAQRLKLASFIGGRDKKSCVIILDEPSTGLHPSDIELLMNCIRSLVAHGHTVLCVEHNLDIIRAADWLIEIGPEGGAEGGHLLLEGVPKELLDDTSCVTPTLVHLRKSFSGVFSGASSQVSSNGVPYIRETVSKDIQIIGAREHNLKNISVQIPENSLTVVTGVSGSGKSTLAFDILFSEGQRRFIDCLSPYARQYIKQSARPEVDQVLGISPTIAVSQRTAPPLGISTLGTVTEVYQYLRLLYSKVGTQHCSKDGAPVEDFSPERLLDELLERYEGKKIFIFSPVVSGRKGHYSEIFQRAAKAEITHARIDGSYVSITEETRLARHKLHWISLLSAQLGVSEKNRMMLHHAISQALVLSGGTIEIALSPHDEPEVFSTARVCPKCKTGYMPLDPQDFSFRSLRGMCHTCGGRGYVTGANERERKVCSNCKGTRLGAIGRNVTLFGKNIHELSLMTAPVLVRFFDTHEFPQRLKPVTEPLVTELLGILRLIDQIGLAYLSLDRDASSLSGGEAQRLRLAKSFGAPLSGVCYVLDEPSIGLHPSDHEQLMETLRKMRDQGNTVVVVEHDEDTIRDADYVIDIGPQGGSGGGSLVYAGEVSGLIENEDSMTGAALRKREIPKPYISDKKKFDFISLSGLTKNNLKGVSVEIPKGALTAVVGVSGAGKSSLVHGCLYPAILESFEGEEERKKISDKHWSDISGLDQISRLIEIDQNSIGKTPASTPASFLGVFNLIRDIFAELPEAKIRGFTPSYFSYNRGEGRCSVCEGKGYITIPMSFLPDAKTPCETCKGLRYGEEALEVKLHGHSIGEILQLTISDAYELFTAYARVKKCLEYAIELGIGYITLGQGSFTLSGGEAQRLKIAKELGNREAKETLYLLDEPTIGLHMVDVEKLLSVIRLLVSKENTVVVIEHNLDVVLAADYIIELGPKPGDEGGEVLFQGTLETFLKSKKKTPTLDQVRKYLL